MDQLDRRVRLSIYDHFVRTGVAPGPDDTARDVDSPASAVRESLERLAAAHVLVLDPGTRRLWMAMPFSAVPTTFRVTAGARHWWANCAWDALGISAMLQLPAEITSSCADCGATPTIRTTGHELEQGSGVVHFAVPAAAWWDDIGFT